MNSKGYGSERKRRRVDDGGDIEDKDSMIEELKRKLSSIGAKNRDASA